jgi:nucleoside-diphosphate-sugar epimerase
MKRILITGGAGFVGSHLCEKLLEHGHDVADACVFLLQNVNAQQLYDDMKISHINIGCGVDLTIEELSNKIAKIVCKFW